MNDPLPGPVIGLLFPPADRAPAPPESLPIGRAALSLAAELTVLVGGHVEEGELVGHVAVPGGWRPARARPDAAIDRFPSFSRPLAYARLLHGLGSVSVLNPPRLTALLRDKVRTQAVLADLGMPELECDARRFAHRIDAWGAGFVKPRFGSFGRGISRVEAAPPARAYVEGHDQPLILQRAISPPEGYAGVALRILVQRTVDGWHAYPAVARYHGDDPVVNHRRGASVAPAAHRFGRGVDDAARDLSLAVAARFDGALELGVDAVLDAELTPHVIEVNARPRGRLQALAAGNPERFGALHAQACETPFRTVASELG